MYAPNEKGNALPNPILNILTAGWVNHCKEIYLIIPWDGLVTPAIKIAGVFYKLNSVVTVHTFLQLSIKYNYPGF